MISHSAIRYVTYLGGAYLFLNLYALLVSDKMIFVPQTPSYTHLPNEVKIVSGDEERINGVYLEHPEAKYTILFSHGNAEDLGNVVPFMRQFHEMGYSVLMYDYRGYGTSEGSPSTTHVKQDVSAAYRWLVEEKKIDPRTIIVHGRSLGGGVAVWLASKYEVGALIIESTFVSAFRVKTIKPLLPWDKFNSLKSIRNVKCPVLIIHGQDDEIIPCWHGRKLYDAVQGPKRCFWIKDGKHNDYVYAAEEKYFETIRSFVAEVLR